MRSGDNLERNLPPATDVAAWARLAAFIDGEGTIYINSQKPSDRKQRRHFLCVMVTSTSVLLMTWIKENFGGTVYSVAPNGFGKKQAWRWQINECFAEKILLGILPYLVIKKQHAEIGLAFRELKKQGRRGIRLTSQVLAKREGLAMQIKSINRSQDIIQ